MSELWDCFPEVDTSQINFKNITEDMKDMLLKKHIDKAMNRGEEKVRKQRKTREKQKQQDEIWILNRVQQLDLPKTILKDIERYKNDYAIRIEKLYTFFLPIEQVNQIDPAELDKWYFTYKNEINE